MRRLTFIQLRRCRTDLFIRLLFPSWRFSYKLSATYMVGITSPGSVNATRSEADALLLQKIAFLRQ